MKKHFKAWLDDFMIYAQGEQHRLSVLHHVFRIYREKHLIISLPKYAFFLEEVAWSGRFINKVWYAFQSEEY